MSDVTNASTRTLTGALLAAVTLASGASLAQDAATTASAEPPAKKVSVSQPSIVDEVERGMRLRLDLGGRYMSVGNQAPPILLEVGAGDTVADQQDVKDDFDVSGTVLFGWDRPFNVPVKADLFGQFWSDVNGEGGLAGGSPFYDGQSVLSRLNDGQANDLTAIGARLRLFSAYVGVSLNENDFGPVLKGLELNLGRMTQMVVSPVTYDGASLGGKFTFGDIKLRTRLWGGFDSPNWTVDDPFSRNDSARYAITPDGEGDDGIFDPQTNAIVESRAYNQAPLFNLVGGLNLDADFFGFNVNFDHAILAAQRTTLGAAYRMNYDFLLGYLGVDLQMTDFVPRATRLVADAWLPDGSTRLGTQVKLQFAEDITAFDGTFLAFNPQAAFDPAQFQAIEAARQTDNIRHLNFSPPKPHLLWLADGERTLIGPMTVTGRVRIRQHFEDTDLDFWNTNILEGGLGLMYSNGMALQLGTELSGGTLNSGTSAQKDDFDLFDEGVTTFVQGRLYSRSALLDGKLNWMNEVFVRRQDLKTRALIGLGQWSGAFATTIRYNILDFWSVAGRFDADLLAPFDSATSTGYFAAHAATSVQF